MSLLFSNKSHGLLKKLFIEKNSLLFVDCVKTIELLYMLYTHDVTCNLSR